MKTLLAILMMLAATVAFGDVWVEVDDAGDLAETAQVPSGVDPLEAIQGTFLDPDADLYLIYVPDPAAFSATTCGNAQDTQLWLFATDGMGISFNDDDPGGCGLQSTVTGMYMTGPGLYVLGVSCYSYDAIDASGNEIWLDSPYGEERQPDGAGAANPLAGWAGTAYDNGPYEILLTGAFFPEGTATGDASWTDLKSLY